ncbi:hypothetical protein MKZ26_16450 [Sporosarcina sp. FSL K6-6792]|uniref:hypothetical protein n=1 Tax=Sporosarcina sp. FSL K6-6792 TaxID=2921559 RepID=UPI0030F96D28
MKKNKLFFVFVVVMLFSFMAPLVSDAYNHWTNKAKLIGGVNYRTFYIARETLDGVNYGSLVRDAVTDWNDRVNGYVDVHFTEINSNHGAQTRFWAGGYGNTGWNGVALFFTYSDGQISAEGYGPTKKL